MVRKGPIQCQLCGGRDIWPVRGRSPSVLVECRTFECPVVFFNPKIRWPKREPVPEEDAWRTAEQMGERVSVEVVKGA